MENNSMQNLLNRVKLDEKSFTQLIMPKVQEVVLELLKPCESQMRVWKNTSTGKQEFERYIAVRFKELPSRKTVNNLWNYYSGTKANQRNKAVIRGFINTQSSTKECAHCGIKNGDFHVDHIIPLAKGGEDEISNLQFLCNQCNLKKSSQFDCKKSVI